jgi:tetratricopeptide (TPR) repeat protein
MTALELANDAWREGRIADARRAYLAIVRSDPTAWGAAFQLAWFDAVFGRLPLPRARGLDRPGLGELARLLVRALVAMAEYPSTLGGAEDDWDIETMRRRAGNEDASWWEERGRLASGAGLHGVALACLEEAEARNPGAYWDPPRWTQSLPAQIDSHLAAIAAPLDA